MEIILVLLITICGAVAVKTIFNIMENVKQISDQKEIEKVVPCPPHSWWSVVNDNNEHIGLICIKCNKQPEQLQ